MSHEAGPTASGCRRLVQVGLPLVPTGPAAVGATAGGETAPTRISIASDGASGAGVL